MGWNTPTVLPYQPSTWERSTLPALQQLGANVALMKMRQGFQAKQAAAKQAAVDNAKTADMLSKGWKPASPFDTDEGIVTVGNKRLKKAAFTVRPVMGPDGKKPLGGQYTIEGGGMEPKHISIAQGMTGPITSIGEGDPYGLPENTVYMVDSKTNKPFTVFKPPTSLTRIEEEAAAKAKGAAKFPTPTKPLTADQINKRLVDLEKAKLKIQTTKGLDPLTMFLTKDNPEAQAAYQAGDIGPAIAEIDRQIAYYQELSGKKGFGLPSGLTEEDVEFNMTKYGKTRQEVIAAYRKGQKK